MIIINNGFMIMIIMATTSKKPVKNCDGLKMIFFFNKQNIQTSWSINNQELDNVYRIRKSCGALGALLLHKI